MPLKNDRYSYRVIWSEDDREYVCLCAEFPSLSHLSKTPESALQGIRELVEGVIKDMKRTGEEIPATDFR
jgi:predicted RNase H-like HicB family nuclease